MRRPIVALACALGALAALPAFAPAAVQVGSSGWQWGNPLPQGNAIRAISFAGTQGYASGDFGTLLHTTDAGASWTGLLSGTFSGLTEVQAIDGDSDLAGGGCVAGARRWRADLQAARVRAGGVELSRTRCPARPH
ncbi:MAG TPA: hypothetical protein VHF51_00700 [Solirubrobacteraceae bacterium]|nr:hypothetical protein [Solirubrobacteraceae bacterium]